MKRRKSLLYWLSVMNPPVPEDPHITIDELICLGLLARDTRLPVATLLRARPEDFAKTGDHRLFGDWGANYEFIDGNDPGPDGMYVNEDTLAAIAVIAEPGKPLFRLHPVLAQFLAGGPSCKST